jgi:hypothetical protein
MTGHDHAGKNAEFCNTFGGQSGHRKEQPKCPLMTQADIYASFMDLSPTSAFFRRSSV